MYDELVKELRTCQHGIFCNDCEYTSNCGGAKTVIGKAADAIDDLQKKLQDSENDNINLTGWLAEEHAKHLWIPVTERLPERNGFYLCLYKHKHPGGVAMDEGLSIVQMYKGKWNLNDIYAVTHWMPLPRPPESEGE